MVLTRQRWAYQRRITTVAVLVVALLSSLLAFVLLPDAARPDGVAWVLPAAVLTYLVLRLDAHLGLSKRVKHAVIDPFGGDVDDAQTWFVAALVGGGVLLLIGLLQG